MHDLKIVGMLGEQDKLVTNPRFGLRTPTALRAVWRRWYGESRDTDLQNLRSLIGSAICMAQLHEAQRIAIASVRTDRHNDRQNDRLIEAICTALTGMQILTRTYHDDQETCAKIELLVQEVKDHINALRPGTFAATTSTSLGTVVHESASPVGCRMPLHTVDMGTAPAVSPPQSSPPDGP